MDTKKVKENFEQLRVITEKIAQALDMSYMEAIHETLKNYVCGQVQQMDGQPEDAVVEELEAAYQSLSVEELAKEDQQALWQWLLLEGVKRDGLHPNYQPTADAVAMIMGYMAARLMKHNQQKAKEVLQVFDPCMGTGNLMEHVLKTLRRNGYQAVGQGIDNDDLMLSIGETMAALEKEEALTLTLGDAMSDLLVAPSQLVVGDLPVGYYPLDETAKNYISGQPFLEEKSHAFSHYLMIEQGLKYMADSGWGLFLVPKTMLNDPNFLRLMKAIKEYGYLQALLNLPTSLFAQEKAQKSLLLVQRHGEKSKQSANVLIGDIPDFKSAEKMNQFMTSFQRWLEQI